MGASSEVEMPRSKPSSGESESADVALFDVLGQRWALHVLWELRDAPLTYRALASRVPGMSTSVLTTRLRELRAASLVEHQPRAGYQLSTRGRELLPHLTALADWAVRSGFRQG